MVRVLTLWLSGTKELVVLELVLFADEAVAVSLCNQEWTGVKLTTVTSAAGFAEGNTSDLASL